MFTLNGKSISPDSAFTTPDGTQYPANWLRLSTPEEKAAIGITEVPDQIPHDKRFYWGYDTDNQLIPKDHSQLVTQWTEQTKITAGTLLSPTDWMIVREVDNLTPVPNNIKISRQNIRILCGNKVSNIGITTTTGELATYVTSSDYSSWTAPYTSWTLNQETVEWEAPVPYPNDGESYTWNEETISWDLVSSDATN